MKKAYIFLLIFFQISFFTACKDNTNYNVNLDNVYAKKGSNQGIVNSVSYKDGTYEAKGDLQSYGNEIAVITISKGNITEVVFQRVDIKGNEIIKKTCSKAEVFDTRKQILSDDIASNIHLLTNEVMKKQSYDISIPTKNKVLLLNWKLAVKRALEKAKR